VGAPHRADGNVSDWGDVLTENHAMLELCDEFGFRRESVFHDASLSRVRLSLR
jgi:hypothetical protein